MKTPLSICCSILLPFICLNQDVGAATTARVPEICDTLIEGKFLRQAAESVGLRSLDLESTDRNSGKFNSELVVTFKPVSKVSAADLAKGLRESIRKYILSPTFAGVASFRKESDTISSVSVHGVDQEKRVRIEADAVTLGDGSVRLKLFCVTSKETDK